MLSFLIDFLYRLEGTFNMMSLTREIMPYIRIARPDHWFKNVFIVPGILLVFSFDPAFARSTSFAKMILGLVCICLVASSNYVLNEILDAPKDAFHPDKKNRPIPIGAVKLPVAWAEFALLAAGGILPGFLISTPFALTVFSLWSMGILYNVPPIRLKDIPFADVLSESVNNPIRLAAGWYSTGYAKHPTLSVVLAYWMFGAFLMATKRFAEYRHIACSATAEKYRKSFSYYTEERLLESIAFYVALFGMFSGVFIARYRTELVLATPLVCYTIAYYLHLGFKKDSPVQHPERLYREKKLMISVAVSFLACTALLFFDIPGLETFFAPWHK